MKLYRSLPPRFKVDVQIRPGTHASEVAVNKQVKVQRKINHVGNLKFNVSKNSQHLFILLRLKNTKKCH